MVMGACGVTFPGDRCKPFFFACALLGGVRSLPLLSPKATKTAVTVNRLRVILGLWTLIFPSQMCQVLLLQAGSVMCWNLMQVP